MKLKIFALLLAGLMLTGCSQNHTVESNVTMDTTTETVTSTTTDASAETQETASEEPYIVTFDAPTLDGETITSDCFAESKLTMLNVWATYCNPCLSEMPDLAEIATAYDSADFQLIGIVSDVSIYSEEDAITEATDLVTQTGATTYPHLLLSESLYQNLVGAIDSVPTTFFVNQEGELLGYVIGAQSKETWEGVINDLLAQME